MTYYDKVKSPFCRNRFELYKEYMKDYIQGEPHEYLGLTKSQYDLLLTDFELFNRLMYYITDLIKNSKVTMIDGIPYRTRRNKLVPINLTWLGKITTDKTIRDRKNQSKTKRSTTKQKMRI